MISISAPPTVHRRQGGGLQLVYKGRIKPQTVQQYHIPIDIMDIWRIYISIISKKKCRYIHKPWVRGTIGPHFIILEFWRSKHRKTVTNTHYCKNYITDWFIRYLPQITSKHQKNHIDRLTISTIYHGAIRDPKELVFRTHGPGKQQQSSLQEINNFFLVITIDSSFLVLTINTQQWELRV